MLKILKKIQYRFMPPHKLAKKLGVKCGKNPKFRTKNFGTEPYLIEIGDNFETSGNVSFVTHDGSLGVLRNLYDKYKDIDIFDKIIIGNNVFIGLNVTLLAGTRIGDNVIIGAGSIVKGKIKSNSVYAGILAKYICSIEEYIDKNEDNFMYTFSMNIEEKTALIKDTFNSID
jgi:acetyltransferase-like isoleucine patch superfamily enzyme